MCKPNHQAPGDDILAPMNGLTPYRLLLVALTCLIIQGEMASTANLGAMSGKICSLSTIHHGPFAWTDDGLFVGIAASEEVLEATLVQRVFNALGSWVA